MLQTRSRGQTISLFILALFFSAAGANHFISPDVYLRIMPDDLPWPLTLVYLSGLFEILGGLGALLPTLRRVAGWGLIALLIAIFPANISMVMNPNEFPDIPMWVQIARLPFQFVLIGWVYWTTVSKA